MRQVLAPYGLTLNARTEGGNARGALQLAHRRSDALEKRRRLMSDGRLGALPLPRLAKRPGKSLRIETACCAKMTAASGVI